MKAIQTLCMNIHMQLSISYQMIRDDPQQKICRSRLIHGEVFDGSVRPDNAFHSCSNFIDNELKPLLNDAPRDEKVMRTRVCCISGQPNVEPVAGFDQHIGIRLYALVLTA